MAINLKAYFFACQAVIAGMRAAGGGAIVNFSSISYMMGNEGYATYTTANAGITGMTRSLARELGPDKIRVNAPDRRAGLLTEKQLDQWATPEALKNPSEKTVPERAPVRGGYRRRHVVSCVRHGADDDPGRRW